MVTTPQAIHSRHRTSNHTGLSLPFDFIFVAFYESAITCIASESVFIVEVVCY